MKKPELLAPCGSFEALRAAVEGGADAVYFGGPDFNARLHAKNFSESETKDAIQYCHEAGVLAYVTMNTLLTDREILRALRYVETLYRLGVDALITADLGLSNAISRYFPDLPLHASTQACGHNADAAKVFADLGFTRMVAARELSKKDLSRLVNHSPIEIEMFVHGAICVCHSGQCLMSSVIGGRSGNRGLCAQPCRLPYNGSYPLSMKDMCLAEHITEILDMGVASLKIEGRMKPPAYVRGVTSVYRRLIDENRNATSKEMEYLAALFSRNGFTDGYFTEKKDATMLGIRREEDKNVRVPPLNLSQHAPKPPVQSVLREIRLPEQIKLSHPDTKERYVKSARFTSPAQIVDCEDIDICYLPPDVFTPDKANGVVLPYPILDSELTDVKRRVEMAVSAGAEHILVTHISQISWASELGCTLHGDYRLNVTNSESAFVYSALSDVILSPELTLPQVRDLRFAKSVIVYGYLPLMTLEKKVGVNSLKDRRGVTFSVVSANERDLILNSVPTYMLDRKAEMKKVGGGVHFIFTRESPREVKEIMRAFRDQLPPKVDVRRIQR